jgi:hypothetical protein
LFRVSTGENDHKEFTIVWARSSVGCHVTYFAGRSFIVWGQMWRIRSVLAANCECFSADPELRCQPVGTTSAPMNVTLTNGSNGHDLTIQKITANGDFSETNKCGATLSTGASCTISITFTPTATGMQAGTLTITDNDPTGSQTVNLSGTGS